MGVYHFRLVRRAIGVLTRSHVCFEIRNSKLVSHFDSMYGIICLYCGHDDRVAIKIWNRGVVWGQTGVHFEIKGFLLNLDGGNRVAINDSVITLEMTVT